MRNLSRAKRVVSPNGFSQQSTPQVPVRLSHTFLSAVFQPLPTVSFLCFGAYIVLAVALVEMKPLWLDEIVQQLHTRSVPFATMLAGARNPGASFLPDFFQWLVFKLNDSRAISRLPAFLFGTGSVFLFWKLAHTAGIRYPLAAAAVFALLPINLRYVSEARPYSQGLFFTISAVLLILKIATRPALPLSIGLLLAITAALYSHPFTIFPIAMTALFFTTRSRPSSWAFNMLPLLGACLLFVPWWLTAVRTWNGAPSTNIADQSSTVFDLKLPLRVLRECTGGGYAAGICLFLLVLLAIFRVKTRTAGLLAASGAAGLLLTLIADDRLDYYFAARHLSFSLLLIVLAASFAFQADSKPLRTVASALAISLFIASAGAIAWTETSRTENWELVAARLSTLSQQGDCVSSVVSDHLQFFEFFRPELHNYPCSLPGTTKMALVLDPYVPANAKIAAPKQLTDAGWTQTGTEAIGKFEILQFRRE